MSRVYRVLAVWVALALLICACQPIQAPVEEAAAPSAWEEALAGKYQGTVVTIGSVWGDNYPLTYSELEVLTGIDIQHESEDETSPEFLDSIRAGLGPDIMEFSYPSPMVNLAREGEVVDLTTFLPMETLQERYDQQWLDWGTMMGPDGPILAGLYAQIYLKGPVWYNKAAFEAAGYQVPTTWEELIALSDQIVADGGTPWCIANGYLGDIAVGETGLNWAQEIFLRTAPLEDYDKLMTGELKFNSPQFKHAVELMSEIWFKPGYVYGGREKLNELFMWDVAKLLVADPPECYMTKDASWLAAIEAWGIGEQFGDKVFGQDYAFFNFPAIDPQYGQPLQVEGHFFVMFHDRPEVRALMEWLTMGKQVEAWIEMWENQPMDVAFSPVKDAPLAPHGTEKDRLTYELLTTVTPQRFTACDLLPLEVSIQYDKSMADYAAGVVDLETALQAIDDSWPGNGARMVLP